MLQIPFCVAYEDGGAIAMARLVGWDATPAVQATISAIAYQVTNQVTGATILSGTLAVADVIYNSLQTDAIWEVDATGFNFRHALPATAFPTGELHRVEYQFTPASGAAFLLAFDVDVLPILMS